jgi:hypothetical protein
MGNCHHKLKSSIVPFSSSDYSQKSKPQLRKKLTITPKSITRVKPIKSATQAKPIKSAIQAKPIKSATQAKPIKSVTQAKPIKSVTQAKPIKSVTQVKPIKQIKLTNPITVDVNDTIDVSSTTREIEQPNLEIHTPPKQLYFSSKFKPNEIVLFYHPELLCWIQSIILRADLKNAMIYPITGFEKIIKSQNSHCLTKKCVPHEPIMTINNRIYSVIKVMATIPNKYGYNNDKLINIDYDKIPRMSKYDTLIEMAKHQTISHEYLLRIYKLSAIKFDVGEKVDLQIGNFGITGWTSGIVYDVNEICYSVAVETPEKGIIGICIPTHCNTRMIYRYKSNSYDGTIPRPHQMVMYKDKFHHIVDVYPVNSLSYAVELYKKENEFIDFKEISEISLENTINFLKSDEPTIIFYYKEI